MPILIRVANLEPGMCLAANLVNRYSVLLPHGHTLSEKDIASLTRRIPDEMVQVINPLLDQIVDFQDNSHDQNVSQTVRKNVATVVSKVSSQIRTGVSLTSDNIVGMQNTIDEMLNYLQQNPVTMALIEQSGGWDDYLQQHSSNVFYLSIVIGNTIRNYIMNERHRLTAAKQIRNPMNLTPLATAALFHDIGMVPLEHLYHKKEPLTNEEKQMIRNHPHAGAEMLPDKVDSMVRLVVRSHHENQNGTGYPEGIPADKINIFAKIIRVADAYTAAISDKAYQKKKSSAAVLYEMLHSKHRAFYDPVVLKVFSSIVPPFPIGAKLKVQNGTGIQWAVVVRHNHKDPFQPEVIIAFDELGDPIPVEQIKPPFHLDKHQNTKILSFAGEDMSFLNNLADDIDSVENDSPIEQTYNKLLDFSFP